MRAPAALLALLVVLLGALQCVRADNSDDIYYAMDAIDAGWGLGFRARYGEPQSTCNCSFTSQVRGPCTARRHRTAAVLIFSLGLWRHLPVPVDPHRPQQCR